MMKKTILIIILLAVSLICSGQYQVITHTDWKFERTNDENSMFYWVVYRTKVPAYVEDSTYIYYIDIRSRSYIYNDFFDNPDRATTYIDKLIITMIEGNDNKSTIVDNALIIDWEVSTKIFEFYSTDPNCIFQIKYSNIYPYNGNK